MQWPIYHLKQSVDWREKNFIFFAIQKKTLLKKQGEKNSKAISFFHYLYKAHIPCLCRELYICKSQCLTYKRATLSPFILLCCTSLLLRKFSAKNSRYLSLPCLFCHCKMSAFLCLSNGCQVEQKKKKKKITKWRFCLWLQREVEKCSQRVWLFIMSGFKHTQKLAAMPRSA